MLNTKEKREACKVAWIKGRETEKYKDIEILRTDNTQGRPCVMVWRGSAGHPYANYYFYSLEKREEWIAEEKKSADRRDIRKSEEKAKGRTLSQSALAAKSIRSILKKEYPDVTFSVKCDNFANGSSVDVYWTDGIPEKEIDSFIRQYEYGTFDGMTDSYNYDNRKDMPQAKYCMTHRTISEAVYQQAYEHAKAHYVFIAGLGIDDYIKNGNGTVRNFLWRKLNQMDLRKGFNPEIFNNIN